MNYLTENHNTFKYKYGFRKKHSMDTCLSYFTNKILTEFDSGLLTGMILVSLKP